MSTKSFKQEKHAEKNYILAPVLKAILDGKKVEVVKTLKANGENVQVSYNCLTQSWVIASKNVALLARERSDIALYSRQARFVFAAEMAGVWFDIIDKLNLKQVEELKSELDNLTLVGEYIGSQEH